MMATADEPNRPAMARPTKMSGHAEPLSDTAAAATKTLALAITSLREQSHAERMFRSSPRCRHRNTSTEALAAKATIATALVKSPAGVTPRVSLSATSTAIPRERRHDAALEQCAERLPLSAPPDHVEAEPVYDGISEHVYRVSEQRGRMGDEARAKLQRKHGEVDPQDREQDAPLALLDRVNLAARIHTASVARDWVRRASRAARRRSDRSARAVVRSDQAGTLTTRVVQSSLVLWRASGLGLRKTSTRSATSWLGRMSARWIPEAIPVLMDSMIRWLRHYPVLTLLLFILLIIIVATLLADRFSG